MMRDLQRLHYAQAGEVLQQRSAIR